MDEEIRLIIEGYNSEKKILTQALMSFKSSNEDISPSYDARERLEEIDERIEKLLNKI